MKRFRTLTAVFLAMTIAFVPADISAQTRSTNNMQTSRSTSSQTSRSTQPQTSRSVPASSSRSGSNTPQTISRASSSERQSASSRSGFTSPSSRTVNSAPSRRSNEGGISNSRSTGISRSPGTARESATRADITSGENPAGATLTSRQVLSSNPNVRFTDGTTVAASTYGSERRGISDNNNYDRYDYDARGYRVHPRHRDPFHYDSFHCEPFYHVGHHYFGYRVDILPPRYTVIQRHGRTYYYYNGVYYTYSGGNYYVSRPPFGVVFTVNHPSYVPVAFNFYGNRRTLAMDASVAIAEGLNLRQTFSYPDINYYYEDGIFFRRSYYGNGFEVVAPPAGALVSQIPDDFDMFTWYGHELYQVEDTIYRPVVVNGIPMLEVVGQVY